MPRNIKNPTKKQSDKGEDKPAPSRKPKHIPSPPLSDEDDDEDDEDWSTDDDDEEDEDEEDEEEDEDDDITLYSSEEKFRKKHGKASSKPPARSSKKRSEEEDDDDEEEEQEQETKSRKKKETGNKGSYLVLNIQEPDEDEADLEDELSDSDNDTADCLSQDERVFMKERYEHIEEPYVIQKKDKKGKKKAAVVAVEPEVEPALEEEYANLLDTKKNLVSELKKRPNKIYEKALLECKEDIKRLVRKGKRDNVRRYHELVHQEQSAMNEYKYFKTHLSNQEQRKIIEDYQTVQKQNNYQKPYRIRILESNISPQLKDIAMHKLDQLTEMMPGDPEYHKLKTWIDTFMKIPFGVYNQVDINVEKDGVEACNDYMTKALEILDECVYGLEDSKLQIMQMLGQWLTNPSAIGTAIAIKGSPGTGKTSLIKDGISKILGREFVFIPLGGASDASYLEGHSYTYEGSMWGKIVQTLIDCKCMNPVIYFDELDKVSETPKGEEIIGVLTHLTDTTQNMQFHDKYFSEIREFDLSKCLFIFSYNDESKINPILLNRMYVIQTKGYDTKEKMVIARKYLLPKICQQVRFKPEDIVLSDDILNHIITDTRLTLKEDGVRNLKRCLEIIYTKLNLYRVMSKGNAFFQKYKDIPKDIEFPVEITRQHLNLLIKNNESLLPTYLAMYN
jgi:ATP-dependent Lon protease